MDFKAFKANLMERRQELIEVAESSEDSRATVELDQSQVGRLSRMDAMQLQQMALATERRREVELKRIDAALSRIEKGDYGYCTACDGDILPKRLKLDPAAPLCIDCASGT
ncbi:MAG: TraR/DksA family transcriptional regulator [Rhodospirillales bacterium]|jgi:DnaK suppressor protein|nr:TraR/DksA family transcriptional regulator [Rhodospirillales bacterium]